MSATNRNRTAQLVLLTIWIVILVSRLPVEVSSQECVHPKYGLIDIAGNGFDLTDGTAGVEFDMGGEGNREPISWTRSAADDAWLVLDRNGNGIIDSSKEMFGNFADQPHASTVRNGFVALAEYDRGENGGDADGEISSGDAVFTQLRLWQDKNHNGVSESNELSLLTSAGVLALDLDYKESKYVDAYGNKFSYRAKIKNDHRFRAARWAWDVTLTTR